MVGLKITSSSNKIPLNKTVKLNISNSSNISKVQILTKQISTNICKNNTLANEIIVSIAYQHLWACGFSTLLFNSPVVTGDENYASDRSIPGTYKIYAKDQNVTLTGSDQSGSWSDPVHYWMPFLVNKYGAYGLHDAPWRTPNQFGNINPDSLNASHGCIELPEATAAWIFNWAPIGTTVVINN